MYGANLSLLNMMLYLREKFGVEPIVLINETGAFQKELEKNSIRYLLYKYPKCTINSTKSNIAIKKGIKKLIRVFIYPFIFKVLKHSEKVDIIHSNSSTIDIGYYLSKYMCCPHIWHVREFGKEDYNLIQIDSINKITMKYRETAYVIAISKAIEKMLKNMSPSINIRVIYNGIHVCEPYKKKYFAKGKLHFCIVGLISPNKRQIDVIKAAQVLVSHNITDFKLHIVGDGKEDIKNQLKSYVRESGLENYIEFTGYIKQIDEYLVDMDVGIVTSVKEAFGRTTIEYMSNYMPVIGSADGGTLELIEPYRNGYLYESGNIEKLAICMERFLLDRKNLSKMGEKARCFSEKFTVRQNAENVYELYTELMQ